MISLENKQNILITGGAGFIGSRLSLALVEAGHAVIVLDNLSPQIHGDEPEASPLYHAIRDKVTFVRGDVTKAEDLHKVLPGTDTVVHLAAETGTGQSMYAIEHYSRVNVGGTSLLLDLIANAPYPVKRLVVASSRAVYGEGKYSSPELGAVYPGARKDEDMAQGQFEHLCPVTGKILTLEATDEDSALHPSSVYGVTKLTQEQLIMSVGQALGISAVAFRYQNVYGPGQSLSNPYTGILSIFSTRMRQDASINIFEDGKESRDFVYIDDVVTATKAAIEHPDMQLQQVFNVGSGVGTDVLTIANTLRQHFDAKSEITVSGQYRVGDIRHNVADLSKAQDVLGFQPTVDINQGLQKFVAWVKGEAVGKDRYEESLNEMKAKGLFK
ncbi:NAD-dependent epimerase/dehydratase family protein [Cohaesibacter gelatinilyticus]|uniref:dTDP-L-rhamnose 4-epimerase n=1 Tax=Cohaesibacter gelatinilyticus TaxID=372072 RepID=A0A285PEI8_9HYPH|nr:NAD-dependent epimerase/dehydratase family protein [Cohaesibacter gelatinilyticus]SNZ20152.1 dTDP-L-rhamnose 4-epimerase [Cohaesibacter gelatinilyticus]